MFAKSIFQSVLERLESEETDGADETPAAFIRGLNAGFAVETGTATTGGETVRRAYAEMTEARTQQAPTSLPPKAQAPPVIPPHLQRLTREDVAADLAIGPADTPETLAEKRRIFAAANHPDRHAGQWVEAATRRMTMANMLIDDALAKRRNAVPVRPDRPPAARPSPRARPAKPA